jgi:hypothetical protein
MSGGKPRELAANGKTSRVSVHPKYGPVNWILIILLAIVLPALLSVVIALFVEVPICIFLALFGCRPFAFYLSGSKPVADITARMWSTIDWYVQSPRMASLR